MGSGGWSQVILADIHAYNNLLQTCCILQSGFFLAAWLLLDVLMLACRYDERQHLAGRITTSPPIGSSGACLAFLVYYTCQTEPFLLHPLHFVQGKL